jgi:hypothetical protein
MTVILMQRPWTPKAYPRTAMGDLVDLRLSTNLNGQGQYVRVATMPNFPTGHTLRHDCVIKNTSREPRPPPTQVRDSMTCLREALSGPRQEVTNCYTLPNG